MGSRIGPRPNLLGRQAGHRYRLEVAQPILTNEDLAKIRGIKALAGDAFRTQTLDATWPAKDGADGLAPALEKLCSAATEAVPAKVPARCGAGRRVATAGQAADAIARHSATAVTAVGCEACGCTA